MPFEDLLNTARCAFDTDSQLSLQGGQQQVPPFADSLVELHGVCDGIDMVSSVLLSLSPSWPRYVSAPASLERLTLSSRIEQDGSPGALAVEVVQKLGPEASVGLGGCALLLFVFKEFPKVTILLKSLGGKLLIWVEDQRRCGRGWLVAEVLSMAAAADPSALGLQDTLEGFLTDGASAMSAHLPAIMHR